MTQSMLRAGAAVLISGAAPMAVIGAAPAADSAGGPFCGAAAGAAPAHSYVAVRHLEARTERGGRYGWMTVRTAFTPRGGFVYEVLEEGGSEQVRSRALRAALEREKELVARGTPTHMPALLASYECAEPQQDESGFVRVSVRPLEPNRNLVNGTLLWEPRSGDVVRLTGRLSKSPSFWVSEVQMAWEYARLAGAVLPTALHARAKVKFVGPSTFDMTYRYISVDGHPIDAVATAGGGGGRQ